jgi:GH24 family phage-related lysozyme (muramidase)
MAIRGKEIGTISKKKTTHLKEEEKEQEQEGVVSFVRKIGITRYYQVIFQ